MRRAKRYRLVSVIVTVAVGGFVWLTACSNYGEGERCEFFNGNEDCENGLQCLPKAQVNRGYDNSDRCCPPNRANATHPACTILQAPIGTDSGPPGETGPAPEASVDAPTETGTDATADAPDDAEDDGG
ncbi:MAG: hypothetical protein KF819_10210 [Labilithrix sp.]|nr:hypothetical protein [Labilithrix sp.]